MRLGILVNTLESSKPGLTTYGLALEATNRGHEVWITSAGHLVSDVDDHIRAFVRGVPTRHYSSVSAFVEALQGENALCKTINIDELDVLLLTFTSAVHALIGQPGLQGRAARAVDPDHALAGVFKLLSRRGN